MARTKKKSLNNKKTETGNPECFNGLLTNSFALNNVASGLNIEKIENVFKLIYRLFLYSVLGLFAKIFSKLFKI